MSYKAKIYCLLALLVTTTMEQTVLDTIFTDYDREIAPNSSGVTTVYHDLSITAFSRVDETNMSYRQVVVEYLTWDDPRLNYTSNSAIDDVYKSTFLNLKEYMDQMWLPETSFSDIADHEWKDQSVVLYPNGTVFYTTYRWVVFLCNMNFEDLPFDNHDCTFSAYLSNEQSSVAVLSENPWTIYTSSSDPDFSFVNKNNIDNNMFSVSARETSEIDVYLEYNGQYHSGVQYMLRFERKSGFFIISFVIPSLLTVFLAYSSFWIDRAAVPARVSLPITTVLMALSLMARVSRNMPSVTYITWMSKFFLGTLCF